MKPLLALSEVSEAARGGFLEQPVLGVLCCCCPGLVQAGHERGQQWELSRCSQVGQDTKGRERLLWHCYYWNGVSKGHGPAGPLGMPHNLVSSHCAPQGGLHCSGGSQGISSLLSRGDWVICQPCQ